MMIPRLRRVSRGGWITLGVVVGAIVGPGVALAAFSDVRIVGHRRLVTRPGQSGQPAARRRDESRPHPQIHCAGTTMPTRARASTRRPPTRSC